jgi:hypothetical protein
LSQDDLAAFHATHFAAHSVNHFAEQFLGPVEEGYPEDTEENYLGYYEDGAKRTLTDEQIAIFRHSEIQALLRERRHAAEARESEEEDGQVQPDVPEGQKLREEDGQAQKNMPEVQVQPEEDLEDGELGEEPEDENINLPSPPPIIKNGRPVPNKENKSQKAKPKSFFKQYVKPDLRKRTWDKVDTGLESLDYDEGEYNAASARPMQRRKISYDDD